MTSWKDRSTEAHKTASRVAGPDGPDWNSLYVAALARQGFELIPMLDPGVLGENDPIVEIATPREANAEFAASRFSRSKEYFSHAALMMAFVALALASSATRNALGAGPMLP